MAKCTECRKAEALDTQWERFTRWVFFRLFPKQIIDINQEKYTQGFGDGYSTGMKHANQNQELDVKTIKRQV